MELKILIELIMTLNLHCILQVKLHAFEITIICELLYLVFDYVQ